MTDIREKLAFLYAEGGLAAVAAKAAAAAYDRSLRRLLPQADPILWAGLRTGDHRAWGDAALPAFLVRQDIPGYEEGLVRALRAHVRPGEAVTVVGTGSGITTAAAALAAGPGGTVTAYEGDPRGIAATRRTLEANGVAARVRLVHAVVGAPVRVYGAGAAASLVAPRDLPPTDVLELDCEGAELAVLDGMTLRPRVIAVESHGCYGAPTAAVRDRLEGLGYAVTDSGWAEPRLERLCREGDIRVLVATREGGP
ncbi:50S ribosomal protein L11 methyltransferase [Methylobacterium sp. JK268]